MSVEFEEGYDSLHQWELDDNPYDHGSFGWFEWREGWITAENDWNNR